MRRSIAAVPRLVPAAVRIAGAGPSGGDQEI
jgi:hypothetical protein